MRKLNAGQLPTVKMKKNLYKLMICLALPVMMLACKKNSSGGGNQTAGQEATTPSTDVLFQTFYWNVPGNVWWDTINSKLATWKAAGITGLWIPVVSKGASGDSSMGYDPYDYFDFGTYNQMGSVNTRFGSEAQMRSMLTNAKSMGFDLIADIVTNHCSGGQSQYSPFASATGYTKFTPMSGKFNRSDSDFHISCVDSSDEGTFAGFPDLCHNTQNVKNWLYLTPESMAQYYKNNLGFDGWRFDYAKGYSPYFVKSWDSAVGAKYSIGEFWDGNVTNVENWVDSSGSGAFDFPLMYALSSAMDGGNMTLLLNAGLNSFMPSQAFTFVANHDIDQITTKHKLMAYAFILSAQGTPFIFYTDYNSLLDTSKMNTLIWIRKNLAAGTTAYLFNNNTQYIFRRNGTPGLVAYFNIGSTVVQQTVSTFWINKTLKDYTGANPSVTTDANGNATIQCQPDSYAIYAP